MTYVTLKQAGANGLEVTILCGQTQPILSDGVSTWDTIARPKRESFTRYSGRLPFQQTLDVLFDGWQDNSSQESDIHKLVTMGTQPHTITLSGHALHKNLDWVITGVVWDNQNTIWKTFVNGTGKNKKTHRVRVRQQATITLLEYVSDQIIKTPAAPRVVDPNKKPLNKITVVKGMTLKKVAQIVFGDPDKWKNLVDDNPGYLIGAGPRFFVPAGVTLVINDTGTKLFVVP